VFIGITWNIIVPKGVGTRITPLTIVVPLLNLILLLLAVNILSWIVGSLFYNTRTYSLLAEEILVALLSSIIP
jgi:hypothetical protein